LNLSAAGTLEDQNCTSCFFLPVALSDIAIFFYFSFTVAGVSSHCHLLLLRAESAGGEDSFCQTKPHQP
jgi:hypothetical protein